MQCDIKNDFKKLNIKTKLNEKARKNKNTLLFALNNDNFHFVCIFFAFLCKPLYSYNMMCIVIVYVWISGNTPKSLGTCSIKKTKWGEEPILPIFSCIACCE